MMLAGTEAFLRQNGVDIEKQRKGVGPESSAVTPIYVAIDGRLGGALALSDQIKPSTPEALRALRADGMRIVMLTGDRRETAQRIAKEPGSEEEEAEVQPQREEEMRKPL